MTKSISTIKNPLTVIAIFAGIAEVSGSAVLPFISEANQETYIWFLMLFPFALISLFFMVLNWNHKVLYAPSDFQDEDNFVNILHKSSVSERLEELDTDENSYTEGDADIEEQTNKQQPSSSEINVAVVSGDINTSPSKVYNDIHTFINEDEYITSKAEREHRAELLRLAHRQSRNESLLFSKLAIEQLEKELNTEIETDVKMEVGGVRQIFDGIARKGNKLTAIETKFFRDMSKPESMSLQRRSIDRLSRLYESLSTEQQDDFSLIVAIITDQKDQRVYDRLQYQYEKLAFPVAIKIYDTDSIIPDSMKKVS